MDFNSFEFAPLLAAAETCLERLNHDEDWGAATGVRTPFLLIDVARACQSAEQEMSAAGYDPNEDRPFRGGILASMTLPHAFADRPDGTTPAAAGHGR